MMMKNKLCAALCALLLVINLGSADHDEGHTTAASVSVSEMAPVAPAAGPVPVSSPDTVTHVAAEPSPSGPDTNTSSRVNSNLSGNTTTEVKNVSLTAETEKLNGTDIVAPTEAAGPEKNQTDQTTPQPTIPLSGSHAPASPTPLTSTTTTTTTTSPTSANPTAGASTTTTPPTNTSHPAGIPLPDSTAPSNTSSTTVPTPEPPKAETTASTTTTTTLVTQSTTTSSTSSTQGPLSTESHVTSLRPDEHTESSTVARQKSTVLPSSSPSAQAKSHASPSQLNDTTMVHNTPTLDPLLAGLVSAFIITAVIITLLLFLKLRRRDNRPEFRRLQDLPMDDMMEDTPLSMYSY